MKAEVLRQKQPTWQEKEVNKLIQQKIVGKTTLLVLDYKSRQAEMLKDNLKVDFLHPNYNKECMLLFVPATSTKNDRHLPLYCSDLQ